MLLQTRWPKTMLSLERNLPIFTKVSMSLRSVFVILNFVCDSTVHFTEQRLEDHLFTVTADVWL